MLVLGIETTCDETAAAVIERAPDGSGKILSNIVRSQIEEHARFGGVVPEIAARAHVDVLDGIIDRAMHEAGIDYAQLNGVAAAAGPGLIGGRHRRPHHRQGDRDGARHAAGRGQPPRGACTDAAPHRRN
ncbi:tRNA A37 threonylcarbamoyltransferase TsaD [Bradyrhizobium sp. i1.3.6]